MKSVTEYLHAKGLTGTLVAQQAGITKQAISRYNRGFTPTAKTLIKIAKAMTELGVPTTAVELVQALYNEEEKNN